jgi:hypothetical protein
LTARCDPIPLAFAITGCGAAGRVRVIDPDLPRGSADAEYCKDGETSNCNWLEARTDEAKSKGLWTIVSMHKVCVTVGKKICEVGAELFNLLLERKVDLVLQGHEHGCQRSKQMWASRGNKKPGHSAGRVLCMRL